MNDRMKKLREVTTKLSGLNEFVKDGNKDSKRITYDVIGGSCSAEGILAKPEISVADIFMEKGTIFPRHNHDVNEWCIVYRGKLQVNYNGGDIKIIETSEEMYLPRGQANQITAIEYTKCVCIVVPSTGGFPDA